MIKNRLRITTLFIIMTWMISFSIIASAATVTGLSIVKNSKIADGVTFTHQTGTASAGVQNIYTVQFNKNDSRYGLVIGGNVYGKQTVADMGASLIKGGKYKNVLAGVNGDHFSFKTGVPMGFSVSNGEILTSTIESYNADEYYFHTLGIKRDGSVLAGENPDLNALYTVGGKSLSIERINRTRETWEGGQLSLFTPAYGPSTDTTVGGLELVIQVTSGGVFTGSSLKGKIIAIEDEGNAEIKQGTVVLSGCIDRLAELSLIPVGTEISMSFTFAQTEWNDVQFAIGGHFAIVQNGQPQHKDYKIDVFSLAQPRTAFGIKPDGTIVLISVDGRSLASKGMTANEMADYLAYDVGCKYAILLDGGGSTAMTATFDNTTPVVVNVPSETRAVGNGVFIVTKNLNQATPTVAQSTSTTKSVDSVKSAATTPISGIVSNSTGVSINDITENNSSIIEQIVNSGISDGISTNSIDTSSSQSGNGGIGLLETVLLGVLITLGALGASLGGYFIYKYLRK